MRYANWAVLWLVLSIQPASAVTFDDGEVHVIDASNSYPIEDVVVVEAPGGQPTTVSVVEGGEIGTQAQGFLRVGGNAFHGSTDASLANISGGVVHGAHAAGASTITITGTPDFFAGVRAFDTGHVSIFGGEIGQSGAWAYNAATMTIAGGQIEANVAAAALQDARIEILGGTFIGDVEADKRYLTDPSGGTVVVTGGGFPGGGSRREVAVHRRRGSDDRDIGAAPQPSTWSCSRGGRNPHRR